MSTITNFRLLDTGTSAKASFDVDFGHHTVTDCRLVQTRAGVLFVSPPRRKRGDEYQDVVTMTRELRDELLRQATGLYQSRMTADDLPF